MRGRKIESEMPYMGLSIVWEHIKYNFYSSLVGRPI